MQKLNKSKVSALIAPPIGLTLLHFYSEMTSHTRPACGSKALLSLLTFDDAGHSKSVSQLSFIIDIVAASIPQESIFHLLSSIKHFLKNIKMTRQFWLKWLQKWVNMHLIHFFWFRVLLYKRNTPKENLKGKVWNVITRSWFLVNNLKPFCCDKSSADV